MHTRYIHTYLGQLKAECGEVPRIRDFEYQCYAKSVGKDGINSDNR